MTSRIALIGLAFFCHLDLIILGFYCIIDDFYVFLSGFKMNVWGPRQG